MILEESDWHRASQVSSIYLQVSPKSWEDSGWSGGFESLRIRCAQSREFPNWAASKPIFRLIA
jgi:hypothetical protein